MLAKLSKALRCMRVPLFREALIRHQVAAGVEHVPVLRGLDFNGDIVDIGANRGQFSLAARYCHPHKRIFAFEPLSSASAKYEKVLGPSGAAIFNAAISTVSGRVVLHVSSRDDSSSLLRIGRRQVDEFPGTEEKETISVHADPLESFLSSSAVTLDGLLKIDVQGAELTVLKSLGPYRRFFKFIYAECSFEEFYEGQSLAGSVAAFLNPDYQLRGIFNPHMNTDRRVLQADFLFERTD